MEAILSNSYEKKIKSNCELVKVKKRCTKWSPIIKRQIWDLASINGHCVFVSFSRDYFPDPLSLQRFDEFLYKKVEMHDMNIVK